MDVTGCRLVTGATGVLHDDHRVVAHSTWLARGLQRCLAAGLQFALVTPSSSRLTPGLAELLQDSGARWAVAGAGGHHDGFSGEVLRWNGEAFLPGGRLDPGFLRVPPLTHHGLRGSVEVVHPARPGTRVGLVAERLALATTGAAPLGWGVVEPVSEPWDVDALTAHVRPGMPLDVRAHVTGGRPGRGFAGTLTVGRRPEGVVERLVFQVDLGSAAATSTIPGPAGAAGVDAWGERELDEVESLLVDARVRHGALAAVVGGPGLLRAPHRQAAPRPLLTVLGPELAARAGDADLLEGAGDGSRHVGLPGWHALILRHDARGPAPDGHGGHARLLQWLDGTTGAGHRRP